MHSMNTPINEAYRPFHTFLAEHEAELFCFLQDLVLLPSYSRNKTGVDGVGIRIMEELSDLPLQVEVMEEQELGNNLIFRSPACAKEQDKPSGILLVGHMDTVFPPESDFNWYKDEGGKIFGPGVIDMKGGLVVAVFALKALHAQGLLEQIPITFICNSDEEIGSPCSRPLIAAEAKQARFGLVFECGGLNGEIVTGRKGRKGFLLNVHGQAGHAAFAGPNKASAVLELAHKIIAIEALNDPERELVVNVGTVKGGIGPNTVPELASSLIDIRCLTQADGEVCCAAIEKIAAQSVVPGTSAELTPTMGRDPMEQSVGNQRLFQQIKGLADHLGIRVQEELRSGVSDANIMAAAGLPVVDGMGPVGDCDHSNREYMLRDSLMEKTLLTIITLLQ